MNSLASVERRLGFDTVLTADFPQLTALPSVETYGDPVCTRRVIANFFANHPDIVGACLMSSEARQALDTLCDASDAMRQVIIARERTDYTEERLRSGVLDAVIARNPGHLVRSAIRVLKARSEGREPLASQERIRIEIYIRETLGED
jgi:LacI family transcriptional regulator